MEYIESSMGFYPSSEGFLQLLVSLFDSSPTFNNDKGGSTPYAEYVCSFVIPRATGRFMNLPRLPFRKKEDFYSLISRAFDVLKCALKSYCLGKVESPNNVSNRFVNQLFKTTRDESLLVLRSGFLADHVTTCPIAQDNLTAYDDFDASKGVVKSSGFTVMRDLMAFSKGNIVHSVADTIRRSTSSHQRSNVESDRFATALAMYGEMLPTWASAQENSNQRILQRIRVSPIFPVDYCEVVNWEEIAISSALGLLCAGISRERLWNQSIQKAGPHLRTASYMNFTRSSLIQVVGEGAGRVSHEMLRVDSEINFIDALVDQIATSHSDEALDSFISLAATCVLFFLDQSLGPDETKDTFYSHKRAQRIAVAFNRRVLLSATGDVTRAKRDLLMLVVERIVSSFRSTRTESSLSMILLGMPFPTTTTIGLVVSGRELNCLDALLTLMKSSSFIRNNKNVNIVAISYEILFNVIGAGKDETRLLLDERLKECNFWSFQTAFMSSLLQEDRVHPQIFHCASWFLKCVCSELHSFVRTGDAIFNTVHPQLFEFTKFYLSLFGSGGFIEIALGSFPLEKFVIERPQVNVNENSIKLAKKTLVGSKDVVQGYEVIDADLLFDTVLGNEYNDRIKSWVGQWNRYTEVDCAASHLSYSIYLAVGALTQLKNSRMLSSVEMDGISDDLLLLLLQRFNSKVAESFDDCYFETATRNLALTARITVFGTSCTNRKFDNVVTTCSLIAKIIVRCRTSRSDDAIVETIGSWGCSLAFLLKSISVGAVLSEYPGELVEATSTLLSFITRLLGVKAVSSKSIHVQAITAVLSALLDFFTYSSEQVSAMVLKELKNDIKTAVSLLSTPNNHMPPLLAQIAVLIGGTPLLLELGVVSSLSRAAESYVCAEENSLASWSKRSSLSERIQIHIPDFLIGHLNLMNVMLVSCCGDESLNSTGRFFFSVIKQYRQVVERLFHQFPVDKDAVHEVLKCILQIKSSRRLPQLDNPFDLGLDVSDFDLLINRFLWQVVEFPLPLRLLPSIPSILNADLCDSIENAVNISVKKDICWWDKIDLEAYNGVARLSTDVIAHAIESLDMACLALNNLKGSQVMFQLHVSSYCRALCRCVTAIRVRTGILVLDNVFASKHVSNNNIFCLPFSISWLALT
jgi:hypothetical protein